MRPKQAMLMAVVVIAVPALALPMLSLKTRAASVKAPAAAPRTATSSAAVTKPDVKQASQQRVVMAEGAGPITDVGRLPEDVKDAFFGPPPGKVRSGRKRKTRSAANGFEPQVGQPNILNSRSALSAGALLTSFGGRDTQFSEVLLLADWDGREDCTADHAQKVDDFSGLESEIDQTITRTAISEHTVANGFNENVYYYGDSLGNVYVGVDTNPGQANARTVDQVLTINLPTVFSAFGFLQSDDQVTITGLAVNPVADLTSFSKVNVDFCTFAGQTGEILYVAYHDTEGLRLADNGTLVRSGILAFPISDAVSPDPTVVDCDPQVDPAQNALLSPLGFPVTVGQAFGVAFSVFSNIAGCAVDDDGSLYFQQVDLVGLTGANIVKIQSVDSATYQDRSLAISPIPTLTTLNPPGGNYGTFGHEFGPPNQLNNFTNYSGTSTTFGNIVALATGRCDILYAAVSRSLVATDDAATQASEGLFTNPAALGPTPSMVISFADCSGSSDVCSGLVNGLNIPGVIKTADGFADPAASSQSLAPGVNNFRVFVQGNGPTIPVTSSGVITANTLQVDMQIDFASHAGLAVDENATLYVISGGEPAGVGKNPSPGLGEILCFEDSCPADRRADFVDYRGNELPNPPASGGNIGDGDSDRFDHIFDQAPIDQVTLTPTGLSGLAVGFLRYTNRLAPNGISPGTTLGQVGGKQTQGDDDTDGTIVFDAFDPGSQAAGGDDQNSPFLGDDDEGAGTPQLKGPLSGGFEFVFGGPNRSETVPDCVWNGFFLNSNGNITFGHGDTDNTPNEVEFRAGLPRIAPAWADLDPDSRAAGFLGTFPVQALGFSGINSFKVRWINVPEHGMEGCGSTNTFSITLWDDGTGLDENQSQSLETSNASGNNSAAFDRLEGPTDLRFTREPNTGLLVGCSPRPEGSGIFTFDYCRVDLLGTASRPVLVGYSIGNQNPLNPPGLCEINIGEAARSADTNPFEVIQGETAAIGCPSCCIGEGTEPTLYEFFDEGADASVSDGGASTFATPDFDLRSEGNDASLCTPKRQRDLNRERVCFRGVGCSAPLDPQCQQVVPGQFVTAPNQTNSLVNALCSVQLSVVGCGFFPNEATLICQNVSSSTGIPIQRPGKTVTTSINLVCDTNGDGIPESTVSLANVTPVSCNVVRGTLATLGPQLAGTAFPLACCGGTGIVTTTTTLSAGDNNVFGLFSRTASCSIDLGVRAPVVISVSPSVGGCQVPQDLLISGACFIVPQGGVTSVFAVEFNIATQSLNTANTIQATRFVALTPQLIDALFDFGTTNIGKTFMLFVTGPGGTSRNLLQGQTPAGCLFGNEQGVQVTFACTSGVGCAPGTFPDGKGGCRPPSIAVVNGCKLKRSPAGTFSLDVFGRNIDPNATITVGGVAPRKVKPRDPDSGFPGAFVRVTLKGRFCKGLPGPIVITNPSPAPGIPTVPSQPFACTETCPAN